MEKPPGIRIEVPEEYGSAYTNEAGEREWVERRQRIGRAFVKALQDVDYDLEDDAKCKKAFELLGQVITGWSLSGDEGPLPEPWKNADAFFALLDSDLELTVWVVEIALKRTTDLIQTEKN